MDNSRFLCMHRVWVALSQVKGLVMGAAGGGIHSISTAYAQARRCCAQVVHMFVHRQHAGHEDLPRGWKRSPETAPQVSYRSESDKAPPCMRWRGLARPRHTKARQLPGFAGAARRPPVPDARARDRFPGSSHVSGVAPGVVPVSNGESILTASASTRARPAASKIPGFPLSTRLPQKKGNYRHPAVVIHRLAHSLSTSDRM